VWHLADHPIRKGCRGGESPKFKRGVRLGGGGGGGGFRGHLSARAKVLVSREAKVQKDSFKDEKVGKIFLSECGVSRGRKRGGLGVGKNLVGGVTGGNVEQDKLRKKIVTRKG